MSDSTSAITAGVTSVSGSLLSSERNIVSCHSLEIKSSIRGVQLMMADCNIMANPVSIGGKAIQLKLGHLLTPTDWRDREGLRDYESQGDFLR